MTSSMLQSRTMPSGAPHCTLSSTSETACSLAHLSVLPTPDRVHYTQIPSHSPQPERDTQHGHMGHNTLLCSLSYPVVSCARSLQPVDHVRHV